MFILQGDSPSLISVSFSSKISYCLRYKDHARSDRRYHCFNFNTNRAGNFVEALSCGENEKRLKKINRLVIEILLWRMKLCILLSYLNFKIGIVKFCIYMLLDVWFLKKKLRVLVVFLGVYFEKSIGVVAFVVIGREFDPYLELVFAWTWDNYFRYWSIPWGHSITI